MPSLPPPTKSGAASSAGARPRPTSHFRVQTASTYPVAAGNPTDETPRDAALRDTTALLDRFALTTLTRAAAATAPSTLGLKLALVERLASPVWQHATASIPQTPSQAPRGGTIAERTDLIRQALRVLDPSDWDDLVDERWADGLCAFAGCDVGSSASSSSSSSSSSGGKPREAYIPREDRTRRSQLRNVRLHGGSLVQRSHSTSAASSHADPDNWSATPGGAYCSERCRAQSEYYRSLAGRAREPEREEMWDEMEQRRRRVRESTEKLRQGDDSGVDEVDRGETGAVGSSGDGDGDGPSRAPIPALNGSSAASSSLLSQISIYEKPLRSDVKPAAPTLADADRDLEAKQAQPQSKPRRLDPSSASTAPTRQPLSLPLASAAAASIPAGQGAHGLPPIRFLTRPREVTSASTPATTTGTSQSFSGDDSDDDFAHGPVLEGIGEEEVAWLEEALREREACERRAGAA